jgi:hypothetical protein
MICRSMTAEVFVRVYAGRGLVLPCGRRKRLTLEAFIFASRMKIEARWDRSATAQS